MAGHSTLNQLERALAEALRNAVALPAFYRQLLDSEVFTLVANTADELNKDNHAHVELKLVQCTSSLGALIVPFFSSREKLEQTLRHHSEWAQTWVKMKGRDLLPMLRGTESALNPGHPEQYSFSPREMAMVLDPMREPARLFDPKNCAFTAADSEPLPQALLVALRSFFKRYVAVRAAYVILARSRSGVPAERALVVVDVDTSKDLQGLREGFPLAFDGIGDVQEGLFVMALLLPGDKSEVGRYIRSAKPTPFYAREPAALV